MLQTFDERNRNLIVNINGRLLHRDQAGVSPFDSAVQGGDAVWEGLRLYEGRIFRLEQHLLRLRRSALALGFEHIPNDEQIVEQLRATLAANGMRDGVHIRLTLSRGLKFTSGMDPRLNTAGPSLFVLAEWKPPVYDRGGIRLITASVRRPGPEVLDPRIHHANLLNSILAKLEANSAGADDALMLDGRGFLAETNATNVFLVLPVAGANSAAADSAVVTPRCVACPEGITRGAVLELCAQAGIPHAVRDVAPAELRRASEAFCTGTMGELAPIIEVDGRPIGSGAPGPVAQRLSGLFRELTRAEGTPVV
ncbi:MAG: aminotransferase class IV [Planctomycetota bacterium]